MVRPFLFQLPTFFSRLAEFFKLVLQQKTFLDFSLGILSKSFAGGASMIYTNWWISQFLRNFFVCPCTFFMQWDCQGYKFFFICWYDRKIVFQTAFVSASIIKSKSVWQIMSYYWNVISCYSISITLHMCPTQELVQVQKFCILKNWIICSLELLPLILKSSYKLF